MLLLLCEFSEMLSDTLHQVGLQLVYGVVETLPVKKAYPNEAEELFAEAQKMAQLRYKTYIRTSQEDWTE